MTSKSNNIDDPYYSCEVFHIFRTSETPCAYLPDNKARYALAYPPAGKHFGPMDPSYLCAQGFRRSGGSFYTMSCDHCEKCRSVRIPVNQFCPNRSQKRSLHGNDDLTMEIKKSYHSDELLALLRRYLEFKHPNSPMSDMTDDDLIKAMFMSSIDTRLLEYRDREGNLQIVSVTDFFANGLSASYTFYAPERLATSAGTFAILNQISLAQKLNLEYLYLGYWIKNCKEMTYKANFFPLEVLVPPIAGGLASKWIGLPAFLSQFPEG